MEQPIAHEKSMALTFHAFSKTETIFFYTEYFTAG